ncbi:hypothetical protein VFPFJ_01295 [Purpureocillium lilacinum]|uniref:Uncharacterized protein n=1 Tax=Purpureocillium lilacinum TaxID=33203 RepID=A0A179HXD6_PURLI|nr:hypothetical protein VFPFJ_01295 [Purpureocillium lilacinum]OAQ95186.1 hypothetical protein VFPFJ_01295 [Purpureocillium lilacinum]
MMMYGWSGDDVFVPKLGRTSAAARAACQPVILRIRACDRGRALRSESLFSPAGGSSFAHCPLRRDYSLPGRGRAGEWAAGWLAGMHEAATAAVACCDMDG